MDQGKIRAKIFEWLRQHYDVKEVKDLSSGSGVPKLSRLEVLEVGAAGARLRYAVKISGNSGRISFSRESTGTWKLLSEVDRVLYGFVSRDNPNTLQIKVFSQSTILNAFESTYLELEKQGQAHLPIWLSPRREEGHRFFGSGFEDQAITETTLELHLDETPEKSDEESGEKTSRANTKGELGIMEHVKELLAEHIGVDPKKIEIEIRIRP